MPYPRTCVPLVLALACIATLAGDARGNAATTRSAPRLELKPARFAAEVAPGTTRSVSITLTNRIDDTLDVRFRAIDLEAGEGDSFARPARERPRLSAHEWISVPPGRRSLEPGERVRERIDVTVPPDARPGAYAVALVASQTFSPIGANGADSVGSRVEAKVNLGSTFVIVVPGTATASAEILDARVPRVVWGSQRPTVRATVQNTGDTLLKLEAATELSSFGAFASRTLRSSERPALPGGRRELEMRWTDRPWIGWFTPRLVVVGGEGSGVRVERSLPTVFVLPPWWVLALVAIAVAIPLASRTRRRRDRTRHASHHHGQPHDDDLD